MRTTHEHGMLTACLVPFAPVPANAPAPANERSQPDGHTRLPAVSRTGGSTASRARRMRRRPLFGRNPQSLIHRRPQGAAHSSSTSIATSASTNGMPRRGKRPCGILRRPSVARHRHCAHAASMLHKWQVGTCSMHRRPRRPPSIHLRVARGVKCHSCRLSQP